MIHVVEADVTTDDIGTTSYRSRDSLIQIANDRAEESASSVENDVPLVAEGLIGDDPAAMIVSYANGRNASYIVIGDRNRTPVGKALFGSVARSVLLDVDRPVVSIIE